MKFPGAPYGLKMACGENPKRVYAAARPVDADGQRRRLSRRVDPGRAVPPQVGQVLRRHRPTRRASAPRSRPRPRDAGRGAARQHPRAQPLLPRRRDGADARHRPGVRLPDPLLPSRGRGLQARRSAGDGRRRRVDLGRLGRLQDGGARRRQGQRRDPAGGRRARDHPLRRPVGLAAAEPGSGQGDGRRRRHRPARRAGRRHQVADAEPGVGARPRRSHRLARAEQERRPGAVVGRSVQRLHPRREGLDRRRAALRPHRRRTRAGAPISSWASCPRRPARCARDHLLIAPAGARRSPSSRCRRRAARSRSPSSAAASSPSPAR